MKICILMAVYEGEKFLNRQIRSILSQQDVDFDLYISIDKSLDNSLEICKKFEKNYENIFLLPYQNIRYGNASQNFLRLLFDVNISKYSYISFSDQDDIWKPFKLSRSIKTLKKYNCYAYSSNVQPFTNKRLLTFKNKAQNQKKYDFLIEGGGAGNTYVLRTGNVIKMIENIKISKKKESINHHDWFVYFYFRSNNLKWYIDKYKSVYYRQHINNEIGSNYTLISHYKRLKLLYTGYWISQSKQYLEITGKKSEFTDSLFQNSFWSCFKLIKFAFSLRRSNTDSIKLIFASMIMLFNFKKIFK